MRKLPFFTCLHIPIVQKSRAIRYIDSKSLLLRTKIATKSKVLWFHPIDAFCNYLTLKLWHLFCILRDLKRREYKGLMANAIGLTCLGLICIRHWSSLGSLIFILHILFIPNRENSLIELCMHALHQGKPHKHHVFDIHILRSSSSCCNVYPDSYDVQNERLEV